MAISRIDVAKLYVALFGRAPEGEAVEFWINTANNNNWDLAKLAEAMLEAGKEIISTNAEYKSLYPFLANFDKNDKNDIKKLIENIYRFSFNKTYKDDPEGIEYWTNLATDGNQSLGKIIANIIYRTEQIKNKPELNIDKNTLKAANIFSNKIKVAEYISYKFEKLNNNITMFKTFIENVNDNTLSISKVIELANLLALKNLTEEIPNILKEEGFKIKNKADVVELLKQYKNMGKEKELLEKAAEKAGVHIDINHLSNINIADIYESLNSYYNKNEIYNLINETYVPSNIKSIIETFKSIDVMEYFPNLEPSVLPESIPLCYTEDINQNNYKFSIFNYILNNKNSGICYDNTNEVEISNESEIANYINNTDQWEFNLF